MLLPQVSNSFPLAPPPPLTTFPTPLPSFPPTYPAIAIKPVPVERLRITHLIKPLHTCGRHRLHTWRAAAEREIGVVRLHCAAGWNKFPLNFAITCRDIHLVPPSPTPHPFPLKSARKRLHRYDSTVYRPSGGIGAMGIIMKINLKDDQRYRGFCPDRA